MSASTIDLATFGQLKETTGTEFVVELVDTFLEEAPRMLEDLRKALAARDADKFRRAAHSLKSNGNTFGALRFGAMARELELSGVESALATKPDPVAALAQEYALVKAALMDLRHA